MIINNFIIRKEDLEEEVEWLGNQIYSTNARGVFLTVSFLGFTSLFLASIRGRRSKMKFMKLGSKPDTFQVDGNGFRYVASELATDIIINVGEVKFRLHKFLLLSKSNHLQRLIAKADEENTDEVYMPDFPAGPKAFEICAKFSYGMTITLNAYNIVAARCAAEYLEMTKDMDRGNLILKTQVFLNSNIFQSWKDSIIALQTTQSLLPWSEDLKIVGKCIDSIASKASLDPSNVTWSYKYNKKRALADLVPKDWWIEDICELEINLYKQVIIAIKSEERISINVIGDALKAYAARWLPNSFGALASNNSTQNYRVLVEAIISLLPSNKVVCCSCSFLLKLLKVAVLVRASDVSKEDLVKRISLQLEEASASDLLIPAQLPDTTVYNVGLVQNIVNQFVMHTQDADYKKGSDKSFMGRESWPIVGKLIDRYLVKIAQDPKLPISSFVNLAQSIPESTRPIHDGLYKAIDIFLKEHPSLTKTERKKICGLVDVKKFTLQARMHAAQNEHLPVRMVIQVLFFEQVRVAAACMKGSQDAPIGNSCSTTTVEENCGEKKLLKKGVSKKREEERDEQMQETGAMLDSRRHLRLVQSLIR